MITIAELEDRREKTIKRIEELRKIRIDFDGLTDFQKDEFSRLQETLDIIEFNLDRHNAIAQFLTTAEPMGGPQ